MPEKTTLSISSTMDDEEMENSSNEKKISNLTKVGQIDNILELFEQMQHFFSIYPL